MGNAWVFSLSRTWQNRIYSAVSGMHGQRATVLDTMTLKGHFSIGMLTQVQQPPKLCKGTQFSLWVGPQKVTRLFVLSILPIRELY